MPIGQKQPTRDRYQEIQTALAAAGYFQGPADGKWGAASVEALRAFQADQGLEPTGKIDARSLMQLGLGPNYGTKTEPLQAETNPTG